MEKFLREWRQDALNKHQYDSAIFIGDKLLAITSDDKDAFWLAQVHFSTGNYTRAQAFLSRQDLVTRNPSCRYLSAHCLIKQSKFEEALSVLGDKNPTHLASSSSNRRRKLQHSNGNARGAPSKSGKSNGKLDRVEKSEERSQEDAADVKFEAAMCYLRGICYAKSNAFDRAKECYKDAVRIDVQCFEAFDQLMKNSLMSPDEEWSFLDSLEFDSISSDPSSSSPSSAQEAAEFTRMLYTTRLSKYKNPSVFTTATETLSTHYNLATNPDLLLSKASLLFTQCRFREALTLTESILTSDKYNFTIYPLHLACLHELRQKNTLFLTAHDLADNHPHEPVTWLAVGIYYLSTSKIAEARRFFSKASMMDPHFGAAWIGFAHTFAAEGEHDQAISAYSTAARLFQGTHLPALFLGMQNLHLNNLTLADEYLKSALALCKNDPLLLNESGVVFYHQDHLNAAIGMFDAALTIAADIAADERAWAPVRANLGHAYRRLGVWAEALAQFDEVLRLAGRDTAVFCAKGLVLLEMGRTGDAVRVLHEALGVSPQDAVATELLGKALEESAGFGGAAAGASQSFGITHDGGADDGGGGGGSGFFGSETVVEEEFERVLGARKRDAIERVEMGMKMRRRGPSGGGAEEESSMMEVSDEE
ncbi:MAG: anaphase promoting complex subunit cdc16 [Piccolia ochrophora]|nr:MAG: anaphase promoting complex subunit cdc16 [Piccolia ochrophora]